MKTLYPLLWRWHFVIGLLTAPILILISLSGALYVFEPQLEPLVEPFQQQASCKPCERLPYARLAALGHAQAPDWVLHELVNQGPERSVLVILEDPTGLAPDREVFLDPITGERLHERNKGEGLFPFILRFHRTLLSGDIGRHITELTISWVFVTLFLGLMLWWPRRMKRGGGWAPRLRANGRRFWRDLHSVTGLYLLPVFLVITFTGLFFSPWAGKSMLAGLYLADQLPAIYIKPPKLAEAPASGSKQLAIDTLIEDYQRRNQSDHFDIHFPATNTDLIVISSNVGKEVWKLRQAHYHPYTGELIAEGRWEDLKAGARAVMLFFPLHTGNILGLGTQILALLSALLLIFICLAGIFMWWQRRRPGEVGLPLLAENPTTLSRLTWLMVAALGLLLPAFGFSLALIILSGVIYKRWPQQEA